MKSNSTATRLLPLPLLLLLLLAVSQLPGCMGFYSYRQRIPNGENVPNPCEEGTVWEGVGHQNPAGAGLRNPFGRDFAEAGFKWTEALCRRDSDGDGRSNGDELGDPDCVWKVGATPARTSGISHPGLCPLDSATCKNDWEVCPKKFECPEFDEPGVFVRNFTLQETAVPPKETVYICQAFELNNTADGTHMIGTRPIIRNKHVMHHMIIYACTNRPDQKLFDSPQLCFMGNKDCIEMMNLWSYGIDGECFNKEAGVLIGGKGYRYGLLELHWNNPEEAEGYRDGSGFSVYMTKDLRKYNQGSLMYGELQLTLPPLQPIISYNHTCPGECTRALHVETRYITWATIHMHQYGVKGRVSLVRNGSVVRDLVPMHNYDYNSPPSHTFDPPIEFLPGDEVKTECYFSTKDTKHSVFWGFDTQQEMCFAFINYFPNDVNKAPNQKLSHCYAHGGINECRLRLPAPHIEAECNVTALRNGDAVNAAMDAMAKNECFVAGCSLKCRKFLNSTFWPSNACFDPKRSKRMAEVISLLWFFIDAPDRPSKQLIASKISLVLYRQAACEQELQALAESERIRPTPLPPTRSPEVKPEPNTSPNILIVVLCICSCLAFVCAALSLAIVARAKLLRGKQQPFIETQNQSRAKASEGSYQNYAMNDKY